MQGKLFLPAVILGVALLVTVGATVAGAGDRDKDLVLPLEVPVIENAGIGILGQTGTVTSPVTNERHFSTFAVGVLHGSTPSPDEQARQQRLIDAVENGGVAIGTVREADKDRLVIKSFETSTDLTFVLDDETEFYIQSPPTGPVGPVATFTLGDAPPAPTATVAEIEVGDLVFVIAEGETALEIFSAGDLGQFGP